VTQQTLSALERNAEKVSADRLLALLSILGVELVLRQDRESPAPKTQTGQSW
jgi:HTH-type transcriptional regulator/antitoxin HipB